MHFNKDLHFALYRAARMPTLFGMIESLWLQIGPVLNLDFQAGPDRVRAATPMSTMPPWSRS